MARTAVAEQSQRRADRPRARRHDARPRLWSIWVGHVVAVAGRAPDAASTASAVACLDSRRPTLVSEVGRGAAARDHRHTRPRDRVGGAAPPRPSLEPGRARHAPRGIARPRRLRTVAARSAPDVRVGAHAPAAVVPVDHRRARATARARGRRSRATRKSLTLARGARAAAVHARRRPNARATTRRRSWPSNHLVALVGQVERLAASCGVPFDAFAPLVQASVDNAFRLGPAARADGSRRARRSRHRRVAPARARPGRAGLVSRARTRGGAAHRPARQRARPAPRRPAPDGPGRRPAETSPRLLHVDDDLPRSASRAMPRARRRRRTSGWCRRWATSMPATFRSSRPRARRTDFVVRHDLRQPAAVRPERGPRPLPA